MSVIDVLREARELYAANPSHAPAFAVMEPGCECLLTALCNAAEPEGVDTFSAAVAALRVAAGEPENLVDWNAAHSTNEVLAAFDEALARAGDLSVLFGSGDVEVPQ